MPRVASNFVKKLAVSIVPALRVDQQGLTIGELEWNLKRQFGSASRVSIYRSLKYLRDELDAPLGYDKHTKRWRLWDIDFRTPLLSPEPEDLLALLAGARVLSDSFDANLGLRLIRFAEELSMRPSVRGIRIDLGSPTPKLQRPMPGVGSALVQAIGKGVVVRVRSEAGVERFDFDPWSLVVGPVGPAVSGYRHEVGPVELSIASVISVRVRDGAIPRRQPRHPPPPPPRSLRQDQGREAHDGQA